MIDPNEAPEGFTAMEPTGYGGCSGCVFRIDGGGCSRTYGQETSCDENGRKDRESVIFIKREEAPKDKGVCVGAGHTMTDHRQVMQQALEALESLRVTGTQQSIAMHSLRSALAAAPQAEPVALDAAALQRMWADYANDCCSYSPPDRRHAYIVGVQHGYKLVHPAPAADVVRDAERYRWLRSRVPGSTYRIMGVIYSEGGEGVDAAIDAAMKGADHD